MADETSLDDLIEHAASTRDPLDLEGVCRALWSAEIYHYSIESGQPAPKGQIRIPLVRLPDGAHALEAFISPPDGQAPGAITQSTFHRMMKIALKMPQADWLVVLNRRGNWLPIKKDQVRLILQTIEDISNNPIADPETSDSHRLEQLITAMVNDPAEGQWDALLNILRHREVYIRLSDKADSGGRPIMITSEANGVSPLAQCYTNRTRSGITYGGMTWADVVGMVKSSDQLVGIHLINGNDDWVILGKSDI